MERLNIVRDKTEHITGQLVYFVVIIAVLRSLITHLLDILITHKVCIQCIQKTLHRYFFLIKYKFLYCNQAVDQVCYADRINTISKVIFRTAPCVIFRILYALIEGKGKCRNDPLEANVIAYMAGSHGSAKFIADLLFDCLFKLFVGIKGSRIAGRLRCLNAIFTALAV